MHLDLYLWFLQHSFVPSCFFWKCLAEFLCRFLTKLLTEDLPKLFVRPKKIVLDFQKGMAVGPVPKDSKSGESQILEFLKGKAVEPVPVDSKSGETQEGNSNFAGELSVTLLDARKLNYVFYGMNLFIPIQNRAS